jgi:hypothetical protein
LRVKEVVIKERIVERGIDPSKLSAKELRKLLAEREKEEEAERRRITARPEQIGAREKTLEVEKAALQSERESLE